MAFQRYIPERGDLIHLNSHPSAGREMQDEHYGLVLSPRAFNKETDRAMICPTTSQVADRDWAFAVMLKKGVLPPKDGRDVNSAITQIQNVISQYTK